MPDTTQTAATLASVVTKLDVLDERLSRIEDRLDDKDHLATDQAVLKARVDNLEIRVRSTEGIISWITKGIIGFIVMSALVTVFHITGTLPHF